jgi:hypothetical protein
LQHLVAALSEPPAHPLRHPQRRRTAAVYRHGRLRINAVIMIATSGILRSIFLEWEAQETLVR